MKRQHLGFLSRLFVVTHLDNFNSSQLAVVGSSMSKKLGYVSLFSGAGLSRSKIRLKKLLRQRDQDDQPILIKDSVLKDPEP